MLVRIDASRDGAIPEWGMIELQGDVLLSEQGSRQSPVDIADMNAPLPEFAMISESDGNDENAALNGGGEGAAAATVSHKRGGVKLGKFAFDVRGKPVLEIGNHRLEGKIVDIAVPFAVLKKAHDDSSGKKRDHDGEIKIKPDGAAQVPEAAAQYNVVGVVSKKYLFNSRPKPVMTKMA